MSSDSYSALIDSQNFNDWEHNWNKLVFEVCYQEINKNTRHWLSMQALNAGYQRAKPSLPRRSRGNIVKRRTNLSHGSSISHSQSPSISSHSSKNWSIGSSVGFDLNL
jgi:hypothetical protein